MAATGRPGGGVNPSFRLNITIDDAEYRRVEQLLTAIPKGAEIAFSTAINKTLRTQRTGISRTLAALLGARKSGIDARMGVFRASRKRLSGTIVIRGGRGVSLIAFGARQNKKGVSARIFGQRIQHPHAFITHGINNTISTQPTALVQGNKLVFERFGAKRAMNAGRYGPDSIFGKIRRGPRKGQAVQRQPLVVIYGPNLADVFRKEPGVADKAIRETDQLLTKNIQSQVDWLLKKNQPKPEDK